MEERLNRVITDMKAIQESFQSCEQPQSRASHLQGEALKELRLMGDKVRRLLWCCHVAKKTNQGSKARVLEMYTAQQVIDRLRAHGRQAARA